MPARPEGPAYGGFEAEEPVRISLAVIYLKRRERRRVIAVDLIRLSPVAEGFTLEDTLLLCLDEDGEHLVGCHKETNSRGSKHTYVIQAPHVRRDQLSPGRLAESLRAMQQALDVKGFDVKLDPA